MRAQAPLGDHATALQLRLATVLHPSIKHVLLLQALHQHHENLVLLQRILGIEGRTCAAWPLWGSSPLVLTSTVL
jgi:hypothetical protein